MEVHWRTEEMAALYQNEQEMGLWMVSAAGHLASSLQLLHRVLYKLDSTHERLEEGEEEVEEMRGLEVLPSLPDLVPMQHEPQVSFQNERMTY